MLLEKYNKVTNIFHKIKRIFYHIKEGNFSYLQLTISNFLRVHLLPFVLHFFPRHVYHFTQKKLRLPSSKERIKKTENPLDDWVILDDGEIEIDSVDIIMQASSFNLSNFRSSRNVYVVNGCAFKDPKAQLKNGLLNYGSGENVLVRFDFPVIYASSAEIGIRNAMEDNQPILYINRLISDANGNYINHNPKNFEIISKYCSKRNDSHIITMYYKGKCSTFSSGSGLNTVIALAKLAKQANVHSWDFYLEDSPKNLTYWQALRKLHDKVLLVSTSHLINLSSVHWLYASRLKLLPHINIQGHLNDVDHHSKIIKKIEKLFYC